MVNLSPALAACRVKLCGLYYQIEIVEHWAPGAWFTGSSQTLNIFPKGSKRQKSDFRGPKIETLSPFKIFCGGRIISSGCVFMFKLCSLSIVITYRCKGRV